VWYLKAESTDSVCLDNLLVTKRIKTPDDCIEGIQNVLLGLDNLLVTKRIKTRSRAEKKR